MLGICETYGFPSIMNSGSLRVKKDASENHFPMTREGLNANYIRN